MSCQSFHCPNDQPVYALDKSVNPPIRRCMNMPGPYIPSMFHNVDGECSGDMNCGTKESCVDGVCKTNTATQAAYATFSMMG